MTSRRDEIGRQAQAREQMTQMSNFGVLSSRTPSVSPPLDTLRHMNRSANRFDHRDWEQKEGYVCGTEPVAYDYYITDDQGNRTRSHRTIVSQPVKLDTSPNISPHSSRSSSLLDDSDSDHDDDHYTADKQQFVTGEPDTNIPNYHSYNQVSPSYHSHPTHHSPTSFTKPSSSTIVTDCIAALHRMGINQTTAILIILAVFIAVQFNQYHTIREIRLSTHHNNYVHMVDHTVHTPHVHTHDNYITQQEMDERLAQQQREYERKLNDSLRAQESKLSNMELLQQQLDNHSQQLQQHTSVHEWIDQRVQPLEYWFESKQTTNWISGIYKQPTSIPFAYKSEADYAAYVQYKQDLKNNMSRIDAFMRGWSSISGQEKSDMVDKYEESGNQDITQHNTPDMLRPHDCVQFATDNASRWMELRLIEPIMAQTFEYIHMAKHKLSMEDRLRSPKHMRLYGKRSYEQDEWIDLLDEDAVLDINESVLNVPLQSQQAIQYVRIEWDIHQAAKTIRLYRMRILGEPYVEQQQEEQGDDEYDTI